MADSTENGEPGTAPDDAPIVDEDDLSGRLWNAFGFARPDGATHNFLPYDEGILHAVADPKNGIETSALLAAARTVGQSMARLAEWEAEQVPRLVENETLGLNQDQVIDAMANMNELVWRRHLASRLDRAAEDDSTSEVIVGFADIVGYTALSRRIQLTELEALIEAFESRAHLIVRSHDGEVVKSIGDAVMFTAPSPAAAAHIALELHAAEGDLPTLCIGLAEGEVLTRMGDVFGEPVNIAARLASSARAGTTLIDEQLADGLADDDDLRIKHIPTLSVRGYRRLKAFALSANEDRSSSKRRHREERD